MTPATGAGGITLRIGDERYLMSSWLRCEIVRDLSDISGSFVFDYDDVVRAAAALPSLRDQVLPTAYAARRAWRNGDRVEIAVDGRMVMLGLIDEVRLDLTGEDMRTSIAGRDVTGRLVDSTANPNGPSEYRGLNLLQIATRLAAPHGIAVRADVDPGDPFHVAALDASETVMSVLEKLGRQRGILITSDGVGGLVLTRGGRTRAPDSLRQPGNIHTVRSLLTWRDRFSDYFVKGQARSLLRPAAAALNGDAIPLAQAVTAATPTTGSATPARIEAAATLMVGHAIDPEVPFFKPRVWLARTQSGSSAKAQTKALSLSTNAVPLDQATLQAQLAPTGAISAAARIAGSRRQHKRRAQKPRTDATPWTLTDQAMWRMRTAKAQSEHLT